MVQLADRVITSLPRLPVSLQQASRDAVILLGHGSLASESGEAMFRVAMSLRSRGLASQVTAGFLNFSEPRIDQVVERCVVAGAEQITIVPYFLVRGTYVRRDVPRVIKRLQQAHPRVEITTSSHLGAHPLLAELVHVRAERKLGRPLTRSDAIVVLTHGSRIEEANDDVRQIVATLVSRGINASIGYLEINRPRIAEALDAALKQVQGTVVATPFFLQLGLHVRKDLPREIESAHARHPARPILLTEHLSYDARLVDVVEARVRAM